MQLGCPREADAFFWWLLHASQLTHPRLRVLYRPRRRRRGAPRATLALSGYRGSRPVRIGNGAVDQRQLDVYGDLLQTAWLYAPRRGQTRRDTGRRLAEIADLVCEIWRQPDCGIWEVRSEPAHFTHSKMMCWVALDRGAAVGRRGLTPAKPRRAMAGGGRPDPRLRRDPTAGRRSCGSYVRSAGSRRSSTPACCWAL